MSDTNKRLIQCFQSVFPTLPEAAIPQASQDSVPDWDSVASIMLINVVGDEFNINVDLERIGELTSFDALARYIQTEQGA